MLTKNIFFRNFKSKKNNRNLRKYLKQLIVSKNEVIKSLTSLKRQEYDELQKLISGYKISKSEPERTSIHGY